MMKTLSISLVLLIACGDNKEAPPTTAGSLTEHDKTAVVERPIDHAPGMSLVFTRTRDDGWRKIDLKIGTKLYPFFTDATRFMLDANGEGFGDRAVICGMSTPDRTEGTEMSISCAVADQTGLGTMQSISSPSSSWLHDVCVDGDRVTLLYENAAHPVDPNTPVDTPLCQSIGWSPTTQWDTTAKTTEVCACAMRDGGACTDPCFTGTGTRKNGICDTAGLAPKCDDGDATTDDFCTGDPAALCYAVTRVEP